MTTHICEMTPSGDTPESARALLYRHGLPEDVVDGVLCLHAQELAAQIRDDITPDDHLNQLGRDRAQGMRWAADVIDPAKADDDAPAESAGMAPAAGQTDPGDVRAQLLHAIDFAYCQGIGHSTPEELLAAYDASRTPQAGMPDCPPDCPCRAVCIGKRQDKPPAADQTETRDRIAETLYGFTPVPEIPWEQAPESDRTRFRRRADALLAVLPDTGHAAAFREAADIAESLRQFEPTTGARKSAQTSENVGILRVADELRRLADETPGAEASTQTLKRASAWGVCDDCGAAAGPDCDCPPYSEQREQAHAEGEHAFCGPECDAADPDAEARQDGAAR